jgi:hypothetical protein
LKINHFLYFYFFEQIGGIWGGCVEAYQNFSTKWADVLDANMTDAETLALGYDHWKWGNIAPRRVMVETAVMGEYFHIYRSFWRSHMCALDGQPNYLKCPDSCSDDTPYEECTCQVDALVSGETTWQNLFPCLLNSQSNRDFFNATMPEELLSDLVYMLATSSVHEVRSRGVVLFVCVVMYICRRHVGCFDTY